MFNKYNKNILISSLDECIFNLPFTLFYAFLCVGKIVGNDCIGV